MNALSTENISLVNRFIYPMFIINTILLKLYSRWRPVSFFVCLYSGALNGTLDSFLWISRREIIKIVEISFFVLCLSINFALCFFLCCFIPTKWRNEWNEWAYKNETHEKGKSNQMAFSSHHHVVYFPLYAFIEINLLMKN